MKQYIRLKAFIKLAVVSQRHNFQSLEYSLLQLFDFTIQSGPFKGMKYINRSNGSVLLPKIAGIYECELHNVIVDIINSKYEVLIDVGCAEGYYAVGFAFINRNNNFFKVYAYDTDTEATKNLKKLAALNNVEEKVIVRELFKPEDIKPLLKKRGIIICDIEGAEKELLNIEANPELLQFDVLVEVHDGKDSNEIKNLLRNRFEKTHDITQVKFNQNNEIRKNYKQWINNRAFIEWALNEGRMYGLDWFYMKRKVN